MKGALWEIILYSQVNLLPYLALALYPFQNSMRLSKGGTAAVVAALSVCQAGMGIWASAADWRGPVALMSTCMHAGFYILLVKAHWGKCLFTLLMLSNIGSFVVSAAKCIEGLVCPAMAAGLYRWTFSAAMLGVQAAVLTPLYLLLRDVYAETMEQRRTLGAWRYLWLIPLTFYAVWFRNFYFSAEGADVLTLRPRHLLYSLVVNAGAMLVYAMVVKLINEYARNEALREREYQLTMQQAQYEKLQERIEEDRRVSHDLRQHLHVISAYLSDGDSSGLREYISRFQKSLPEEDGVVYCENYAVNALLQYFSGQAKAGKTEFSASVRLDRDTGIPDEVLTVVLGNLLENAVEACAAEPGGSISVRGTADEAAVFFKVINTSRRTAKMDRQGYYLSTKHRGRGIGLKSVQDITGRYSGLMRVNQENGTFTVSVLLNIPEEREEL